MRIRSFRKTINRTSIYPLASFIMQKFFTADPELRGRAVSSKNGPNGPTINITFIYLSEKPLIQLSCSSWPLSFCKILTKFLELIQSYKNTSFLHQIGPKIAQNKNFSKKVTTCF